MRRPKQKSRRVESVKRHFALFWWKTCIRCGYEWRREWGWAYDYPSALVVGAMGTRYLCRDCAPDRARALELAEEFSYSRPPVKPKT